MTVLYMMILSGFLFYSCSSVNENKRDLSHKEIFSVGFPRTLAFRGSEQYQVAEGYEEWEKTHVRFNSITKKYVTDNVRVLPGGIELANMFVKNHPEKLMLLHLNGEARSVNIKEIQDTFFPGHWIYEPGTYPEEDIDENQTTIRVQSAKPFSETAYTLHARSGGNLPHDILIVEIDGEGNRLWYKSEYTVLEKVDYENNTITIKRGQYFSTPRSFKKGSTYIAPIAGAGWGEAELHQWYYNLSAVCPKDENGKTCADLALEQIISWFDNDGITRNIDGIGFDVNYFTGWGAKWDCNNDGIADKEIPDVKNIWRPGDWQFLSEMRKHFGPEFILTSDSWRDDMQRAVGVFNGMETEGLCRPNDGYRQISRTINQHTYWNMYNNTKYKFSYITSKLNNDVDAKFSTQLHRMGIGVASCLGVAYAYGHRLVIPEADCGIRNQPNWLGQPVSDLIFPAKETPDLLNGAGIEMNDQLLKKFDFSSVSYRVADKTLFIKGRQSNPYAGLSIPGPEILLPGDGDLIIFFEAKAVDGYFDFKTEDRIPRKINIRINGTPSFTLPDETPQMIAMHNDLAGYIGTPGFTPMNFYFRKVGREGIPVKLTIEVEEQGEFAIRNLTVHNASCSMAREFENGVVLVNPAFDEMSFNLDMLCHEGKNFQRIKAVQPSGEGLTIDGDFEEVSAYNNGEEIIDPTRVVVPGLNALFLIKK